MGSVNEALRHAYEPGTAKSILDGILGILSGWVLEDIGVVGPKRRAKEIEGIVDRWNEGRLNLTNEERWSGDGKIDDDLVELIPLRRTAYMSLDIQIPDPKIRIVGEDEDASIKTAAIARPDSAAAEEHAGIDDLVG